MSETGTTPEPDETQDAAAEAAQNAVDETTSWEYSAERDTIERDLDEGLEEAGVDVEPSERRRLVDEIDDVKDHEDAGSPRVDPSKATPAPED